MIQAKSTEKVDIEPGMYRGIWGGYDLEILGASRKGSSIHVKTDQGVRGVGLSVIVQVDHEHDAIVYDDMTAKKQRHDDNDPITPDYIRQLVQVRKGKIGPYVGALNGALIRRSAELARSGQIYVDVKDIMGGADHDMALEVANAFCESGFKCSITTGQGNEDVFDISLK